MRSHKKYGFGSTLIKGPEFYSGARPAGFRAFSDPKGPGIAEIEMGCRIGFDVGGTFTDFVMVNDKDETVSYFKLPSTPADPSIAIAEGLAQLIKEQNIDPVDILHLGHGTTVATNLVIERKGSKTALLTTRGFRDVLEIGRQIRPHLYDYSVRRPRPLVPRELRFEVSERILSDGTVRLPLADEEVDIAARAMLAAGVESVLICFLHSYHSPEHERRAGHIVRQVMPKAYVSLSSEVLPEFREFERMSTTALNAYVGPKMGMYLDRLAARLVSLGINCGFDTIHSNGGLMSAKTVCEIPVRTCLSGPAAGVMGASRLGVQIGYPDIVTFDVGGTSTDVSVIVKGRPLFAADREVAQYPVRIPMVDIHVIGAGGGSIARIDAAGALKVGPQSAGADPGPVAYGRGGTEPTITDANIVLGRLDSKALLNGRLPINAAAARLAIESKIAQPLGLSVEEAAHGILQIACANMNRAIQSVSTEKGHDVRNFALMAFGGAGPLHAGDLAAESGIATIIIPIEPGTLCARGILLSDISRDYVRSKLSIADANSWVKVKAAIGEMTAQAERWLAREGVSPDQRAVKIAIDARYDGQNYEVIVQIDDIEKMNVEEFIEIFRQCHKQEYGYDFDHRGTEIVNCRVQAIGSLPKSTAPFKVEDTSVEPVTERQVYFGKTRGWNKVPVFRRAQFPAGAVLLGPAIVEEMSSTTLLHPSQRMRVDSTGNLIITYGDSNRFEGGKK
jgi:N-methylhydantoinase A